MAGSVNKAIIVGNLGKDPETRTMPNGNKVVTFSVATSDQWTDKNSGERRENTQWHTVAIWNEALGEIAARHLRKGAKVYVDGAIETRSWDAEGITRYATEIVLRPYNGEIQMLDRRPDAAPDRPTNQLAKPRAPRREPK